MSLVDRIIAVKAANRNFVDALQDARHLEGDFSELLASCAESCFLANEAAQAWVEQTENTEIPDVLDEQFAPEDFAVDVDA